MSFFLDTNIVVNCLRGRSALAMRRLQEVSATEIFLPMQVHAELLLGAAKSANPTQSNTRLLAFLSPFHIVWPNSQIEGEYVAIRKSLEQQGTPIGEADLWIAATVRTAGGTLVTNNTGEFARVPNLSLADWTLP